MIRLLMLSLCLFAMASTQGAERPPNVVLIYCDDLGYGDLGCYGTKNYTTPHLDRLAAEGMRFTDFHTAAAVCSASRAALLSGCYAQRIGIMGALSPKDRHGIHADEKLLPEYFRERGYATAIYGKWHLGHLPEFLPTRHGFDDYFGLPYSNDMRPSQPTSKYPALPLIEKETTIATEPDQSQLTEWYTARAEKFIETNKERPFFVYVPHTMPHIPLFASEAFRGKSGAGLYGDVIQEIDASVGRITAKLDKLGLSDNTIVLFSSDNGPWLIFGNHGGVSGGFREGKGTTFEGGMRVPFIAKWPGKIPAGSVCKELTATIDVVPTLAKIIGAEPPKDRVIDGRDIRPLLFGEANAKSPHESFYYYWIYGLDAVRSGPWKLHFPHPYRSFTDKTGGDGKPGVYAEKRIELSLFNLDDDPAEQKDVAAEHPDVVARLQKIADAARDDLGDSHRKLEGKNRRPAGRVQ